MSKKEERAGVTYAANQIEGDHFMSWVRDQMYEASQMDPSQVLPLETKADAEVIARNMLQQLGWDVKRDLNESPDFFKGFSEYLDRPDVIDWLADEILFMHEQATGRTAEAHEAKRRSTPTAKLSYQAWLEEVNNALFIAHRELLKDYPDRVASLGAWWADGVGPIEAAERLHAGPSRKFGRTAEGAHEARRGSSIRWTPSAGGTGWLGRGPSERTYLLRRAGRDRWNLHIEGHQYGPFDSLEAAKAEAEQHEQATGRTAEARVDESTQRRLERLSPEATREGLYGYRGASVELSGPAGGRWQATVRFRQQETDFEGRSAKKVIKAAMDWIDQAPELNETARRPSGKPEVRRSETPPKKFKSQGGRTFTIRSMKRIPPRFEGDSFWKETWPIFYKGKLAGKLFRSGAYRAPLEWHATIRELYWEYAPGAPTGIGFDVAAYATPQETLEAWGRSADQILDWSEGKDVDTIHGRRKHSTPRRSIPSIPQRYRRKR